jgi:CRP-like cAMP-binding protein
MLLPPLDAFFSVDSLDVAHSAGVGTEVDRFPERFRYADVAKACPGVSRPTIQRAIRKLRDAGEIELLQKGRDAEWRRLVE